MKQINIKLEQCQIDHLKTVGNRSEYVRRLIEQDSNKPCRYKYIHKAITDMLFAQINKQEDEMHIISKLAVMLGRAISGEDVMTEIMEGGQK